MSYELFEEFCDRSIVELLKQRLSFLKEVGYGCENTQTISKCQGQSILALCIVLTLSAPNKKADAFGLMLGEIYSQEMQDAKRNSEKNAKLQILTGDLADIQLLNLQI